MISVNSNLPQISTQSLANIGSTVSVGEQGAALRPATDVIKLGAGTHVKTGDSPELREPRSQQGISDRDKMTTALSVAGIIAELIGMLSQIMLQDSKRVSASSAREMKLAESSASAQRKAGVAEMSGGMAQAAAMFTGTAIGSYRSVKGSNIQLNSTRTNSAMAAETQQMKMMSVSPRVQQAETFMHDAQSNLHSQLSIKGSKFQSQGDAIRSAGTAMSKVAEASQATAVNSFRAEQTTASADASVAGRTTELEMKSRSTTDDLMNQMRAIRDRDNQSKNETESHVAQNAR